MTSQIFSSELDYSTKEYLHPQYSFTKILPLNASQTQTLSATSVMGPTTFLVPDVVWNSAQSYMSFDLNIGAAGSGLYPWMNANMLDLLNRFSGITQSGTILCDINSVGNFYEAVSRAANKEEDICDLMGSPGLSAALATAQKTPAPHIQPCNAATNNYVLADGSTAGDVNAAGERFGSSIQYAYVGPSANAAAYISVRIPLSAFKFTNFAIDKDMYYGTPILINCYWEALNQVVWGGTDTSDCTASAATFAGTCSLSNLALYCAQESNLKISLELQSKVKKEGLSLVIPKIYQLTKTTISSSTTHTLSLPISKGLGKRLLFMVWCPYNVTQSGYTSKNHAIAGLSQFNTFLDNLAIQSQSGYNISLGEQWSYLRDYLTDSCLANQQCLRDAFTWFDNWSGMTIADVAANPTTVSGVDVGEGRTWQLQAVSSSQSWLHYVFAVTQQVMTILPSGDVVVEA